MSGGNVDPCSELTGNGPPAPTIGSMGGVPSAIAVYSRAILSYKIVLQNEMAKGG
jgi:hypothetical protein